VRFELDIWRFCEHINEVGEDRIALVCREEIIEFFKETETVLYLRTTCHMAASITKL